MLHTCIRVLPSLPPPPQPPLQTCLRIYVLHISFIVFRFFQIRSIRKRLGWVVDYHPKVVPMISDKNKEIRYQWCKDFVKSGEDLDGLLFSDESTIWLENHATLAFRKKEDNGTLGMYMYFGIYCN